MHPHISRLLLAVVLSGAAFVAPAMSQATKKKVDLSQLSCGQKVLIDDLSCQAGQVLEITGSCLDTTPADGTRPRGIQYNCLKKK
jgi:hypothetical protein